MKPVMIVRHVPDEALGNLALVLEQQGLPLARVECFAGDWRRVERAGFNPEQLAGLVVMGGPMNVDQVDEFPFLEVELRWLRQALDANLPVLGVCLGAQLLAKTLGQPVYKNRVQEIGWYEIEMLPACQEDPLFAGSAHRETVLEWHGDTFELPPGAVQLARGATCEVQAFRFASGYGVQFHPEITAEMVEDWLAGSAMCGLAVEEGRIDAEAIRAHAQAGLAAMWPLSERIFTRFAVQCRARCS